MCVVSYFHLGAEAEPQDAYAEYQWVQIGDERYRLPVEFLRCVDRAYYQPCPAPTQMKYPPVDNKTRESFLSRYDNIANFRGAPPTA